MMINQLSPHGLFLVAEWGIRRQLALTQKKNSRIRTVQNLYFLKKETQRMILQLLHTD